MSDKTIGVILMAVPILWLCADVIRAYWKRKETINMDLRLALILVVCWMAGRILAGEGMISIALRHMG